MMATCGPAPINRTYVLIRSVATEGEVVAEVQDPWIAPEGSWASTAAARRTMLGNAQRESAPEIALRSAVHRLGIRFRVGAKPAGIGRSADLVLTRARVAVFLDGCFWHKCPEHFRLPATNTGYWQGKIDGNARRDRETDARLRAAGWTPVRIWEHELPDQAAARVSALVSAAR
jgi:DNA mismatch endonuclease (patch repair protein)